MKNVSTLTLQTLLIIGVAFSALIGAVGGSAATFFFSSAFPISSLVKARAGDISPRAVESKIIELIEEESATIAVVERITPAVVSIVVKKEQNLNAYPGAPQAPELVEVSSGTGFFVTENGFILTNRHVIDEEGALLIVVTNDGEEIPAKLVDADPFQDIALLQVQGENYPTVTLGDSQSIRIGQTVIAIGNTLSEFRNTVTKGVISGINRRVTAGDAYNTEVIEQAIQTDAAINPGNSGGPLINLLGEVIGMNTAVSFQGESIAFAIPINEAKRAIADVEQFGRIIRPWLGVRYVLVEAQENPEQNFEYDIGALIVSGDQPGQSGVFSGSPADLAGLKEEDIIIAVNDQYLTQESALSELIAQFHPGDIITLSILRSGVLSEIDVTLAEYKEE